MKAKPLGLLLACVTLLGCSSSSTLFAHNDSDVPIQLVITDDRGEQFNERIEPGEAPEAYNRYGPFSQLKFKVNGRELSSEECPIPAELTGNGSDGLNAHWHWDGARAVVKIETLSNFGRMVVSYLVAFGLVFGLIVLLIVVKRRQRRAQAYLGG